MSSASFETYLSSLVTPKVWYTFTVGIHLQPRVCCGNLLDCDVFFSPPTRQVPRSISMETKPFSTNKAAGARKCIQPTFILNGLFFLFNPGTRFALLET